jgi:peroxiredoxin
LTDFSRLPAPEDDGAADHLPGSRVPDWLPGDGTLVAFVYPMTGTPGRALPEGWDQIPGARGCTDQSCAFRDRHDELAELGADVVGISAQPPEEQREFAEREQIPYELVNDEPLRLAAELDLPTFEAQGRRLYRRLTFIARNGEIAKVFYPVFPPDRNAGDVADWLRANPAQV